MGCCTLRKGQIFSLDMIFAFAIFLVLLLAALSLWSLSRERTDVLSERTQMGEKAELAMYTLLLNSGNPQNWYENTSFQTIGLSSTGDYQIDIQKLSPISNLNLSTFKSSLGLLEYYVFLNVTNRSATVYSFGDSLNSSAVDVVHLERVASMNRTVVTVYFEVWDHG